MALRLKPKEKNTIFDSSPLSEQFVYIEVSISPDDTLLSLSMKFNVTVSDLKRLNSLQNDRDVYALSFVKIPIKKNSIFAEQYEGQLKYGDPNLTRLNTNSRLDSSLEREIAEIKLLNEQSDEEFVKPAVASNAVASNRNTNLIMETQFNEDIEDQSDTTALLNPKSNGYENSEHLNSDIQVKNAKRFFKKIDHEFESLKTQNQNIINNVNSKANIEQLIPISSSIYTVESYKNDSTYLINNFCTARDILIIGCFLIVLTPLAFFVYSLFDSGI